MNKTIDEQPGLHRVIGAIEQNQSFNSVSDFELHRLVSWLYGPEETTIDQKDWIRDMKAAFGITDEVTSRVRSLRASDNYANVNRFLEECYAKIKQERRQ